MKLQIKKLVLLFCGSFFLFSSYAQSIFNYGSNKVEKDEFRQAYLKNAGDGPHTSQKIMEYLQLYAIYKMKVAEAKNLGYDVSPQLNQELENFKSQITPQYLVHEEYIQKAIEFSDYNSRREIKLGITEFENSESGEKQAWLMYDELKTGKPFEAMALKYSIDSAVKNHKGNAGYITAFILPYELEKVIFSLNEGSYCKPVRTESAWYIFANLKERPASGTITISQIFFSFPPEYTAEIKQKISTKADSVYQLIINGGDFASLATELTDDIHSAASGGILTPFTVGEYANEFSEKAFSLLQDGEVSKPFETEFGIHIIKRMELASVPAKGDKEYEAALKSKILNDYERMQEAQTALANSLVDKLGFKELENKDVLIAAIKNNDNTCNGKTDIIVFSDGKKISCGLWFEFASNYTDRNKGISLELTHQRFTEFVILQHYANELEQYNKEYALLLNEFREGNLLFEIMQKEVWEKAVNDSAGQEAFYKKHQSDYKWTDGANMIIFSAYDSVLSKKLMEAMLKDASDWRYQPEIADGYIFADSGRMEYKHVPFTDAPNLGNGKFTKLLINDFDGSYSFAYILNKIPGGDLKDFESARGLVMLDYQKYLEDGWIKRLKEKYPLKVNKREVNKLVEEFKTAGVK